MTEQLCDGKIAFKSKASARARVRFLSATGGRGWRKITAYPCPFGDHWHIGHELGMHAFDRY